MLVPELIPKVDRHVKIGSANVLRKKTRMDYTFSLKLANSRKRNFEQPPNAGRDETLVCFKYRRAIVTSLAEPLISAKGYGIQRSCQAAS